MFTSLGVFVCTHMQRKENERENVNAFLLSYWTGKFKAFVANKILSLNFRVDRRHRLEGGGYLPLWSQPVAKHSLGSGVRPLLLPALLTAVNRPLG